LSPTEENLEVLVYRLGQMETSLANLESKMNAIEKNERSKLLWGVMALGSVVMALGGVIWTYRNVIFRGVE
jgi:hypothetical protein